MAKSIPQIILTQDMSKMPTAVREALDSLVMQTNSALNQIFAKVNSKQTFIGMGAPENTDSFTVQGKSNGFWLIWRTVPHSDRYLIVMAVDAGMNQVVARIPILDGQANSFFIYTGTVTITRSFQLYAGNGTVYGLPSTIKTASTTGVGDTAPSNPPEYSVVDDLPAPSQGG